MGRRSDHSREELKELTLAAAIRIVQQDGYDGLSARKVAGEIGYTVGTLYLVFSNLDELILHVNGLTLDELYSALKSAANKSNSPQAGVIALGNEYIRFATQNAHRWEMIYEHRYPEGEEIPQWYMDKVMRMFELVEDALRPLVGEDNEEQISIASRAIWSGVHGICILAMTGKLDIAGVDSIKVLTDSLIKNYLIGFISSGR